MNLLRFASTIKGFMLITAFVGALLLFLGGYGVISSVYDRTVRSDAHQVSEILAGQTFDAMFQVMRKGWKRQEVEEFLAAMRNRFSATPYSLEIYRSPVVEALFGPIAQQPASDEAIRQLFADGQQQLLEQKGELRHLYPLQARQECLHCHTNAQEGTVLGVIDLRQDLRPLLDRARSNFMATLWLIVPLMLAGAFLVAWIIQGRLNQALDQLRNRVSQVNKVSDLAEFSLPADPVGFRELDDILSEVRGLSERLRTFAVDKELLEFEIRLLERFIITSEVVRDWREYVNQLLIEINQVMEAYILFSVFKVEEELFDLEIFWRNRPTPHMTQVMERNARTVLQRHPFFKGDSTIQVRHNVANPDLTLSELAEADIELQSKSLFVETPKIGGIVGIGVQAGMGRDPMRLLVTESILSTLLNVVGSVKAIYKYTKELEYYATRDPLTNLYNQRVFWELAEYEIERAKRKDEKLSLLVIDLDNFKNINDTYGHALGDSFLQRFAEVLRQTFRLGDIVARYGGDEFVAMLTDTPENQVHAAAERLVADVKQLAITAPDGQRVGSTISVGVAIFPQHGESPRDMFLVADNMMYRAKTEGKNRVMFADGEDVAEIYRDMGEKNFAILAALEDRRFVPYYQPIVSSNDCSPFAYEVLGRMVTPEGEVIPAAQYIETAERMGVVHQLDYQVMEKAFIEIGSCDCTLFINLSPKALVLSEFVPTVVRLAKDHDVDPKRIVFELTERETVRNISLLQRFVLDLKMEGFQFAIDDFGSGFSSFHYLKHFPIDFVKIDGDFIVNLLSDQRDQVFVRHMAAMARELGIRTIAEFVESQEVLREVQAAGIDLVQGFLIGRPNASAG